MIELALMTHDALIIKQSGGKLGQRAELKTVGELVCDTLVLD